MTQAQERVSPIDILMDEEKLKIRFQTEWNILEEATKMAFHAVKHKYSEHDY